MKSLTPFIIIALSIAMYFFYISPAITEVQTLSDKKAQYNDVLNKVEEIKQKRDAISSDYNNISGTDLERLNKIVPEEFNSVLFVNDINSIAGRNGITLKNLTESAASASAASSVVAVSEVSPYKKNIITLQVQGQYSQFINFLTELESSLQLIDISKIDFTTGGDIGPTSGTTNSLPSYSLEINVYSLR